MAFSVSNGNGSRSGLGRRRFGAGNGTLSEINIVPLVDVVLVLLIIFMLTAHVMEFGLEINVPEVKQVKDTNEELPGHQHHAQRQVVSEREAHQHQPDRHRSAQAL